MPRPLLVRAARAKGAAVVAAAIAPPTLRLPARDLTTPIAKPELGTTPKTAAGAVKLYDAWAGDYDETLRSWDYPAPRRTAALLQTHLSAPDGAVLDAGCGTGLSGEALRAAGFSGLIGTDVSAESLQVCARKGVYSRLEIANLEEPLPFACVFLTRAPASPSSVLTRAPPPLRDDHFSAVACVGVLSYVRRFDVAFSEFARVTRPRGIVVFTHRSALWDDDVDGVRTSAEATRGWKLRYLSEPEEYMPLNPDPKESAKRIRYGVYEAC